MIATKKTDSMMDKDSEMREITELSENDTAMLPPRPRKRSSPKRTLTQTKLSGSVAGVVGEESFGEAAGRNLA